MAGLLAAEPFALETFGRLGPSALRLLRAAWQRAAEADPAIRGWAGQALMRRWLGLLNVELQRSLFDAVSAAWGKSPTPAEAEPWGGSLAAACVAFGAS